MAAALSCTAGNTYERLFSASPAYLRMRASSRAPAASPVRGSEKLMTLSEVAPQFFELLELPLGLYTPGCDLQSKGVS